MTDALRDRMVWHGRRLLQAAGAEVVEDENLCLLADKLWIELSDRHERHADLGIDLLVKRLAAQPEHREALDKVGMWLDRYWQGL